MRRFKILGGISLLIITFFLATASSFVVGEHKLDEPKDSSERAIVEIKKNKVYKKRRQELRDALKAYFNDAIQSGDVVGAGVSIVHEDSIVLAEGFGKRSIGSNVKVNGETVFRLGSLSKGFAGVLTVGLESRDLVDCEDKVVTYLPEFKLGDQKNTEKIKLRHILSHSSGTPYHSFTNLVEAGLPMDEIAKRFKEVTPINEPGEQYSYQNAMFALSQEIVLAATGKSMESLLSEWFFDPLGMSSVSMDHSTLIATQNVALPHAKRKSGWKSLPLRDSYYNAIAAGGINASSTDMGKWMRFLLGHGPKVVDHTTVLNAFKPSVEIEYNAKYYQKWPGHIASHYGLGWRIHNFRTTKSKDDITVWHHGGSVNNYRNEIAVFPDSDLGICVLLNGNSRIARTVIPDLYAIVETVYSDSL